MVVKFHRLAWLTTIVIGIQMILAGVIVGENAGFVSRTWPFIERSGSLKITGALIFELVHRCVAALLGVLVIWLLIWLLRSYRHNRAMIWTCSLGLLSLAIQIVYAGLIVLFVFPGTATTVDVLNSIVMLSLFVHLSNLAQREYDLQQGKVKDEVDGAARSLKPHAWTLYAAGMVAVAAGAVFRHTGASQALFGEDSYIASHNRHVPPSLAASHWMLFIHISTAAMLVMAATWFAWSAFKNQRFSKLAVSIFSLIMIQAFLGMASLNTRLQLIIATMHWADAGLIMGVVALVVSHTYLAQVSVVQQSAVAVNENGTQGFKKHPRSAL